ncbi:MAG TPA: response regulator [Pirellulales bacterium]|jgi:two-component system KDP operon response regulator KdpE|nr:response regulator [Pirellulales bacterium]
MSTATSSPPLVLLVEDEAPMRKFLRAFLSGAGYRIEEASAGEEALSIAAESPPDVVILDLGLPDMDGQEVLRKLRDWLKAPIIVLSVRNQDVQKISALDHGADDYLQKPFSTGELLARIRVALRHTAQVQTGNEAPVFESGDLKVDLAARRVFVRGEEVHLTRMEYNLLTTLVRYAGKVLTHQFLLAEVWGPTQAENTQHLRVFMAGLRRKIEADPAQPRHLLTEQGVGYRLAFE